MKSLSLAAGAAMLMLPTAVAQGAVLTLGGPLSQLCYQGALAGDDRKSALEACSRSLDEESLTGPDRAATLVNRGIIHMIRGHDGEADADFDAALKIDNRASDAWLNKGFLRLRQYKSGEALSLIEEGIKRQPRREALAYFARGVAHEDLGQLTAAYNDLRRAHDLEPNWTLPKEYLARYQSRNR
jgi:tetratricopeptide (TPR) repeat protein